MLGYIILSLGVKKMVVNVTVRDLNSPIGIFAATAEILLTNAAERNCDNLH